MFHSASEICIEKAQSFQAADFDADILTNASHDHTGQKAGVLSLRLLCAPRAVMQ